LVLAGVAALFQWQGWFPASCIVGVAVTEAFGIFLLIRTVKRNQEFATRQSSQRSIVLFGVAVFFILFGVGLALATVKVLPDLIWSLGAFLIAVGATFIYRALILPNSNSESSQEDG
jgi:hypothetical protein